jgi:hypothetical protein
MDNKEDKHIKVSGKVKLIYDYLFFISGHCSTVFGNLSVYKALAILNFEFGITG